MCILLVLTRNVPAPGERSRPLAPITAKYLTRCRCREFVLMPAHSLFGNPAITVDMYTSGDLETICILL
jgi:hypothetical protein